MESYQLRRRSGPMSSSVKVPSDSAFGGMLQSGEEKELGAGLTLNALPWIGRYRVTMR